MNIKKLHAITCNSCGRDGTGPSYLAAATQLNMMSTLPGDDTSGSIIDTL